MIPFADLSPLHLGPLTIQVFGLTVAVAALVGLDFLHVSDATYARLTPAQWMAAAVIVSVPFLWHRVRRGEAVGRRPVASGPL